MPDTAVPARLPSTPAEVAAAVLDAIEYEPAAFHMGTWATLPTGTLAPGEELECGTTMCVAGWAAHLTGYTLKSHEDGGVIAVAEDGRVYEVEEVAAEALDLGDTDMFWETAADARAQLRVIAGR
ncbi:hypothetical protein [Streptomyces sp. NPDC051016]|uniref:hypothetical protein n=1 Tax=Streptomyces sp. NPDC051016 TaxID=3365638 RepID=UPI0037938B96